MTATDELRALLDERGVEWEDCGNGATYVEHNGEAWRFDYDEPFDQLGIVCLSGYTPEQAVAATLGETPTPHVEDLGRLHDELRDAIVEILGNRCDWNQTGVRHAHEVLERAATLGTGTCHDEGDRWKYRDRMRELGVEVDEPAINVVEPTTLATDNRGSDGIRK